MMLLHIVFEFSMTSAKVVSRSAHRPLPQVCLLPLCLALLAQGRGYNRVRHFQRARGYNRVRHFRVYDKQCVCISFSDLDLIGRRTPIGALRDGFS